ncbi:hypothetical protein D1872_279440 [compost metagenome]
MQTLVGTGYVIDAYGRPFRNLMVPANEDDRQVQFGTCGVGQRNALRLYGHHAVDSPSRKSRREHFAGLVHECGLSQQIGHVQISAG